MITLQGLNLEIERKNSVLELLDKWLGYISIGNILTVFAIPIIIVLAPFVVLYFIFYMKYVHYKIKRINSELQKELYSIDTDPDYFKAYSFKDAKYVIEQIDLFFDKKATALNSIALLELKSLKPLNAEIADLNRNLKKAKDAFISKMYIPQSGLVYEPMSAQEEQELREFFGPDELYEEDTFLHNR